MKPQDIHVFVFDSLSDWEMGYTVVGINSPHFQRVPGRYRIRTVARRRESVLTMGGIRIQPDMTLDQLSPAGSGMFIMPGGETWDEGKNIEAVEYARSCLSAGIPVAAICGATAGLARGGLLDDRRHTSNSREYLAATQYSGAPLYEDSLAVTDKNVTTAPGSAPLEFALHVFRRLDLFSPQVLDAWYCLFKTGKPECFATLVQSAKTSQGG